MTLLLRRDRCGNAKVFRNANVVKGGPSGGGAWPALNRNDTDAARPPKLSKCFSPCLCSRQIFWCEISLLSYTVFLILAPVSEHRRLVRGWMAAILAAMFQRLLYGWNVNWIASPVTINPANWSQCPLMPAGFCCLRCNSRATTNCIVAFLPSPRMPRNQNN